jgi:hypothetical protein
MLTTFIEKDVMQWLRISSFNVKVKGLSSHYCNLVL